MLQALKRLFTRSDMPASAREAFARARTPEELLRALDKVCAENEVELRRIELEVGRIERTEQLEIERARDPEISERQKKLALQRILRLRRQIKTLDDKIDIHTKNINLLSNLMSKIQLMQSMAMQGVEANQIDAIVLGFQENFEHYQQVLEASEAGALADPNFLSSRERADLDALDAEIAARDTERQSLDHNLTRAVAGLEQFTAEGAAEDGGESSRESVLSESERAELRALEAEILGATPAGAERAEFSEPGEREANAEEEEDEDEEPETTPPEPESEYA